MADNAELILPDRSLTPTSAPPQISPDRRLVSQTRLDDSSSDDDVEGETLEWTEKDFRRLSKLAVDDSWIDAGSLVTGYGALGAEDHCDAEVVEERGSSYLEYVSDMMRLERSAAAPRTPGPYRPYMSRTTVKPSTSSADETWEASMRRAMTGSKLLPLASDGKLKQELELMGCQITDLRQLQRHRGLQYINASHNLIESIGPLSNLPQLYYVNVAFNRISSLDDFSAVPKLNYITYLNLSNNKLKRFPVYNMPMLMELDLQDNRLTACPVMEDTTSLKVLLLQNNCIHSMADINAPKLEILNLARNNISKIENLTPMVQLKTLDLSHNPISSLLGIENLSRLEHLIVPHTKLHDVKKLENAWHLPLLWNVSFAPGVERDDASHRKRILGQPWKSLITVLDEQEVTVQELTDARLQHNPPLELWAVQRFAQLKVKRFMSQMVQPSHTTMPGKDTSYPMLILVGPPGSGKRILCQRLLEDFSEFFGFGVSHTTRSKRDYERDQEDYYFVSDSTFSSMIAKGDFVQVSDLWGHHYGLSVDEIERHASRGLATVTHMELDGALQMRTSYFNPRLVMVVTSSETVHEERMWQRSCYRTRHIQHAVQKTTTILNYHNEHPSMFDIGINSDTIETAHQQLCNLVQDYLGLPFDPLSVSRTSGTTSCADDTTVMSSALGSTSTLDTLTSRRTTPASGIMSGTGTTLSSTPSSMIHQHHRNPLKWSLPSSRSSTGIDKSSVLLLPHDGSQIDL